MQVLENAGSSSIAVWIERADGTILRGAAETVSSRGAQVVLPGRCAVSPGETVVLRVCFSPERPNVAASGEVRWTRPLGEAIACGVDWDLTTVELGSDAPAA
jgi:hypothetical protein